MGNVQNDTIMSINSSKVLIAEDNPMNAKLLSEILKKKGYEYYVVENGNEVLKILEKEEFGIILMDIQMPVLDGLSVTKIIRGMENVKYSDIPIIAVTAYAMDYDKDEFITAGMNDYLSKPIRIDLLMNILNQYMKK